MHSAEEAFILWKVTYNPSNEEASKDTLKSIEVLKKEFGEEMHIGAGTVLTVEQVEDAREAGASISFPQCG